MNCAYCGERFQGNDDVITLKISGELLHDGDCFVDHMFEQYGDGVKRYYEYLEDRINEV